MTRNTKHQILSLHSVETRVSNGRLEALDVYQDSVGVWHEDWVDVEQWTKKQLAHWLGY